jgi:hypothetical protein
MVAVAVTRTKSATAAASDAAAIAIMIGSSSSNHAATSNTPSSSSSSSTFHHSSLLLSGVLLLILAVVEIAQGSTFFHSLLDSNSSSNQSGTRAGAVVSPAESMTKRNSATGRGGVVELSLRVPDTRETSPITVAICHKTLFGDIQEDVILRWAAFHRLLGFDQIYIWYVPDVLPKIQNLKQIPYITLIPNTQAKLSWYEAKGYYELLGANGERDGPGGQQSIEMECLSSVASNYTWVLNSDADEFFYSAAPTREGIKDFLARYTDTDEDYYYLSFGKKMYSLNFALNLTAADSAQGKDSDGKGEKEAVDSGFGLDRYGYTHPGYYCFKDNGWSPILGSDTCPMWQGSSKLFVRPKTFCSKHSKLGTHGVTYKMEVGMVQFPAGVARFLEFPFIFSPHNVTVLSDPAVNVTVQSGPDASFSFFDKAFLRNEDGSMTLSYDGAPRRWFQYVRSRAGSD